METKYTAIVIEPVPGEKKPLAYKYEHGVIPKYVKKFCADMKARYKAATHINFYDRATRRYVGQIRL